ncbi:MAG TPA: hypothetical protein VF623_06520, partial [Segetibacter sp.]
RGYSNTPSVVAEVTSQGLVPGAGKGIQKQCAAVFERGLWSRVATTQPRGLSSQGIAFLIVKQKVFTAKSILQSLIF